VGCNLRCRYCQNWHISQKEVEEVIFTELSPEELVEQAKRSKAVSISFTYTEPVVSYEYTFDVLNMARENGLRTSVVSNGCINTQPLQQLLQVIDAIKVDLKGFTDQFYREISSGELQWLKQTLKTILGKGVWLEIVNLVIPTKNDDPLDLRKMCTWIAENLGRRVPVHFTRFYPAHKMTNIGPTPVRSLETAYTIAQEQGLEYVYIGNVPGHRANSTFCHDCGKRIIHRNHFTIVSNDVVGGSCAFCGEKIPGLW
jgi:pyruvate formate lyase activating enzyme